MSRLLLIGLLLVLMPNRLNTHEPVFWSLDPVALLISQSNCGDTIQTDATQPEWNYFRPDGDSATYLCSAVDGSLEGPLPSGYHWGEAYTVGPMLNPDATWLVIIGLKSDAVYGSFDVFSYELVSDRIVLLGSLSAMNFLGTVYPLGDAWGDATHGWLSQLPPSSSNAAAYFSFDLERPNSLIQRFWAIPDRHWPRLTAYGFENLASPSVISTRSGSMRSGDEGCIFSIYGPDTEQQYDLGYDCLASPLPEYDPVFDCNTAWNWRNQYLFLTTENAEDVTPALIAFNPSNGERQILLEDEIERLIRISHDERYIFLLAERDGELTNVIGCDVEFPGSDLRGGYTLRLDTQTNSAMRIED
ncbi:MAG TPA: hypothetical protein PLQ56_25785 [Aggregatilineales bacterium]|nr:hypothetical protein [Aggregatilineales bacterium]